MDGADLGYLSLTDAARLIRRRELSPVELVESLLERIAAIDGRVMAFLTVDAEGALAQARAAEQELGSGSDLGPVHGVPVAIKDIIDVAGLPTTAGSRVLAGNVAREDAALVAALRGAGAVILGKTNTHEFAYGVITPPTRNPWNLGRIPGGSSGGSAAALAAGLVPGAVGTDTAGSIRLPAALCGIVGLKPTYGRVSRHGVIPLSWSLDHAGPMTRSVADAALMLGAMAGGSDPRDPATSDAPVGDLMASLSRSPRGLRVGVPRRYFYDFEGLDRAVGDAAEAALQVLGDLGMDLREVEMPLVEHTFALGRAVQRPEASAYHRARLRAVPELYGDEIRGDLELGELFLATDYIHAQRVRAEMRAGWLEAMRDLDILVVPTVPCGAPEVREGITSGAIKVRLLHNTYPFNLVGFPGLSLPCGLTAEGLPIGMQIVGRPYDEATVLCAGHAYEQAAGWHPRRPPLS